MKGFALYRLPYATDCTLLTGEVEELAACGMLSDREGFVVAPFAPSADLPVLVIRPEQVVRNPADNQLPPMPDVPAVPVRRDDDRDRYHTDFVCDHQQLMQGHFQKLVLARSTDVLRPEGVTAAGLFRKACDSYPRLMTVLVYTPQSGLWLVATPEILLEGQQGAWQTIALAGTMAWGENICWSDKNIQEQRYVASYIEQQLERFADSFTEDGPYTARAGHLAHLRSDFCFTLSEAASVGTLLEALHPTPAVCGLPKEEAFRFICHHEHDGRSYYSGFMGPLCVDGQTHLFVTLRCMQLFANCFRLYAGGGLLKDSDEQQEWQETEEKMNTMRHLL